MIRPATVLIWMSISLTALTATASDWPQIKTIQKQVLISEPSSSSAGIELEIREKSGRPLYELKCHSGDYVSADNLQYSGLIQCYLFSLPSKSETNLLADDNIQPADWTNRGRFLLEHILPKCSHYPEWGSVRHFELRGMTLTLSISDITWAEQSGDDRVVKSYRLNISAEPKPARSPFSKRVEVPRPEWFYKPQLCRG